MNADHTREHDSVASSDATADVTLDPARRATLIDRLRAVVEPSSSVDHLMAHLTGDRVVEQMTVVDWTLPLPRTGGGVALYVVRPDGAAAYLGFADGDFRATPWRPPPDNAVDIAPSETAHVAPRDWFPENAQVVPLPVESTPFDG